MKPATIAQIKRELKQRDYEQLLEICLRLGKFKKDNKELMTYLLFEQDDEQSYIQMIKYEIDDDIDEINRSHIYYSKKSLRKVLRKLNKYIRYSGNKQTEVDILIHFCSSIKNSGIRIERSRVLINMYDRLLVRIDKALDKLHEDLQADYKVVLEEIR